MERTTTEPLDLLIVGAGISGIDLAHHVLENFPDWRWEIHDTNDDLGGTWHTFRYPGIRSDSDMATFSFPFHPLPHTTTLGEGADIKEYIRDVAREDGALEHLHLRSFIRTIIWVSSRRMYEVTAVTTDGTPQGSEDTGGAPTTTFWARRVHLASGYFAHGRGYRPSFPREHEFTGRIIHPQQWPEDLEYEGKNFVIVGSGATAVTLVPALQNRGANVTMVQRTANYVAPLNAVDHISRVWNTVIPSKQLAGKLARNTHALRDEVQYVLAQRTPWLFRKVVRALQRQYLPAKTIDAHFTPSYKPWDQRVCKAPDGDIFTAINNGAEVVTDTIDTFTPAGLRVSSGREIPADYIISATGLELEFLGGGRVQIDGRDVDLTQRVAYRGVLLSGLPNLSFTVGYLNASWTQRAELVSHYMIELWQAGEDFYAPTLPDGRFDVPLFNLDAGYIRRTGHLLLKQGDTSPWIYQQSYPAERKELGHGDKTLDMAFGEDALRVALEPEPARVVHSVQVPEPFAQPGLRGLPETHYIDVDGRRIRVRDSGTPITPVVVAVHGIGRSLEDFDDQMALWGSDRRFIAVDIPGFGFSDPAEQSTLGACSELLWGVVDKLLGDEQRVHLMGNSLGGAFVMELTAQRPERVESAALIDPSGFGSTVSPLLRLTSLPVVGAMSSSITRFRPVYQPVEHLNLRRPGAVTAHRLDVQGAIAKHPHRTPTFHAFSSEMFTPAGEDKAWDRAVLSRFTKAVKSQGGLPIFLAWGTGDLMLGYNGFASALKALPVMRAVVFEECGHMPQQEYPVEFAEQYAKFLAEVRA